MKNKSKEKSDERESVGFDFSMQKKIFSNSGRSRNLFNFKATKSVEDQEKEVPDIEILVFKLSMIGFSYISAMERLRTGTGTVQRPFF